MESMAPAVVKSSHGEILAEKKRIMKNVILISVAFLMNFNAFQGLSRLQSTLNLEDGIGVITSSIIYASLILSCMFLPKIIINWLGHKWTIALAFLGYIAYMAANGYPTWYTLVPASVLVGLAAAPLWTAQCSYFTLVATKYSRLAGEAEEAVVSRFFGIFFFFFQLSAITGSVISATILRPTPADNITFSPITDDVLASCGRHDCPGTGANNTNLAPVDGTTRWTMVGVYLAVAVGAVLLVAGAVDNLPPSTEQEQEENEEGQKEAGGDGEPGTKRQASDCGKSSCELAVATFRHLRHPHMVLLIPLTMYSGFEQASFNAEFSKSFVSCSLGIWKVGLVTLPFGVVNAAVSFGSGYVIKYTGRLPVFLAGMCVDVAIQVTLMTWMPRPEEEYVLYILAAMWGFTDGIWQTQINAFYGCIFTSSSEAAFSNYRLWESVGFIIPFAYSSFVCTSVKLYVLIMVLILGMSGYLFIEFDMRRKAQMVEPAPDSASPDKETPDKAAPDTKVADSAPQTQPSSGYVAYDSADIQTMAV